MRRFSRHQSRQKLSFDNELSSSNLLKIRGWTSQLVVISGNEDTSGHQLLLLKASNYFVQLRIFPKSLNRSRQSEPRHLYPIDKKGE